MIVPVDEDFDDESPTGVHNVQYELAAKRAKERAKELCEAFLRDSDAPTEP